MTEENAGASTSWSLQSVCDESLATIHSQAVRFHVDAFNATWC